jgi:hypothetical protein
MTMEIQFKMRRRRAKHVPTMLNQSMYKISRKRGKEGSGVSKDVTTSSLHGRDVLFNQGLTNSSWTSRRISYCQSSREQFSNTSTKYLLSKAFPFMFVIVCSEEERKRRKSGRIFFCMSRVAGFEIHTFRCTDESHAELLKEYLKALPITLSLQHQGTPERLSIDIAHI